MSQQPPQNIKVVNTPQAAATSNVMKIAQLNPGLAAATPKPQQQNLTIVFIVLEQQPSMKTKEHVIEQYLVSDDSACISLRLWDYNIPPNFKLIPGDIYKLSGGYCTSWKGSLGMYVGRKGKLERMGEFTMLFNEAKNMSMFDWTEDPTTKRWIPRPPGAPGQQPLQQPTGGISPRQPNTGGAPTNRPPGQPSQQQKM